MVKNVQLDDDDEMKANQERVLELLQEPSGLQRENTPNTNLLGESTDDHQFGQDQNDQVTFANLQQVMGAVAGRFVVIEKRLSNQETLQKQQIESKLEFAKQESLDNAWEAIRQLNYQLSQLTQQQKKVVQWKDQYPSRSIDRKLTEQEDLYQFSQKRQMDSEREQQIITKMAHLEDECHEKLMRLEDQWRSNIRNFITIPDNEETKRYVLDLTEKLKLQAKINIQFEEAIQRISTEQEHLIQQQEKQRQILSKFGKELHDKAQKDSLLTEQLHDIENIVKKQTTTLNGRFHELMLFRDSAEKKIATQDRVASQAMNELNEKLQKNQQLCRELIKKSQETIENQQKIDIRFKQLNLQGDIRLKRSREELLARCQELIDRKVNKLQESTEYLAKTSSLYLRPSQYDRPEQRQTTSVDTSNDLKSAVNAWDEKAMHNFKQQIFAEMEKIEKQTEEKIVKMETWMKGQIENLQDQFKNRLGIQWTNGPYTIQSKQEWPISQQQTSPYMPRSTIDRNEHQAFATDINQTLMGENDNNWVTQGQLKILSQDIEILKENVRTLDIDTGRLIDGQLQIADLTCNRKIYEEELQNLKGEVNTLIDFFRQMTNTI